MMTEQVLPEWAADPAGRHEVRYWDGASWTANVSDGGQQGDDPVADSETFAPPLSGAAPAAMGGGATAVRTDVGVANGPEAASNGNRWPRSRLLQVGGLAAMGIGLLMPWITAGFISANGIDTGDGKLFGFLLLAAAGMVWFHETRHGLWRIAASLSGALLLVFSVFEIIHVYDKGGNSVITVSPGSGLWIDALGAAALLFGAGTAKAVHRNGTA